MSLFTDISVVRRHRGEWGLCRTVYWIAMETLARLGLRIHYVTVTSGRDDLEPAELPALSTGYTARTMTREELLPHVAHVGSGNGLWAEFVDEAFAANDECGAAFHGDELVAYLFVSRSRTRVTDQLDVLIPRGFRYPYKAWTHRDHRRRNLTKAVRYVLLQGPGSRFRERRIGYTETHNYPSLLHSYEHPNFRSLFMGYVGWINVFGRQIPFNSRQAKRLGFEFVRRSDEAVRQYVR